MKRGKKYIEVAGLVDRTKHYPVNSAIELMIKTARAKFDETVELHVKLGVDGRNAEQQVRGVVVLPHGTGKVAKVLAITKGANAEIAQKEGADFVGAEEMIAKIQSGWMDFDVCVTTPDMMGALGKVARILGPKGLMPNPKSGTVTTDIKKAINDIKAGKVEYRLDKGNIVHVRVGKVSFGVEKLNENLTTVMEALIKAKPAASKGTYIKGISISSTMGPGIKIEYKI